jgi:hypothetical protein
LASNNHLVSVGTWAMIAWKEGEKKVGNGKGTEEILRVIGWRRGRGWKIA